MGEFSLNSDGAKAYQELSDSEKLAFLSQLRVDLATLIPIRLDRLSEIKFSESRESKMIFTLTIKSSEDEWDRSVDLVMSDLDALIRGKEYTAISRQESTKYLDSIYGFQKSSKYSN
jgi:hypothetical protein